MIIHLYFLDAKVIFSRHFHQFFPMFMGDMSQNVLYVELIEHENCCSDLLLCSLQNVSIFLYSNNIFFNHMAIYKNLNCIFQQNVYVSSLFTEIGVYLRLAVKPSLALTSVNNDLIY